MIFCTDLNGNADHVIACDNGAHHFPTTYNLFKVRFAPKLSDRFDKLMQGLSENDNKRIKRTHTYILVCPD